MCGRYTVTVDPETIYGEFACVEDDEHRDLIGGPYGGDLARPRYNIAPTDQVPVVLERSTDGDRTRGVRRLEPMRWGLVPSWAKDVAVGNRMFNTRVESLVGEGAKATFRTALQRRRCLLPASGFYEWQALDAPRSPAGAGGRRTPKGGGKRAKQAYYITPADGSLMALAGLWEFWRSPDGEPVRSATVITVPAVGEMADIHDRMPLMLPRESWGDWLQLDAEAQAVTELLLRPGDDVLDAMEFRPVGDRVGNVRNDNAELIQRVEPAVRLDEASQQAAPAADQPTLL
jgi:putative SOS response-associated peptidase YedK